MLQTAAKWNGSGLSQSVLWCEGDGRNVAVYLSGMEQSLSALSNRLCPSLYITFIKPAPTQADLNPLKH